MNINGINPNIGEIFGLKPADKANPTQNNSYNGASFASSLLDVAKQANIQVAGGNQAAASGLKKEKEETVSKLFSFIEAEEEQMEESLARIHKMLKELRD